MNQKVQGKNEGQSDIVELANADLDQVAGGVYKIEVVIVVADGKGHSSMWIVRKT
jgi:hypothetical protein